MDAVFQPLADFQSVISADAAARARDSSPCVMAYLIGCGAECVRHPRKGAGLDNSRLTVRLKTLKKELRIKAENLAQPTLEKFHVPNFCDTAMIEHQAQLLLQFRTQLDELC